VCRGGKWSPSTPRSAGGTRPGLPSTRRRCSGSLASLAVFGSLPEALVLRPPLVKRKEVLRGEPLGVDLQGREPPPGTPPVAEGVHVRQPRQQELQEADPLVATRLADAQQDEVVP